MASHVPMAAGVSDGTDAKVALVMERLARPLATRTPMVGACRSWLADRASLVKKKPLAPESAILVCWRLEVGVGC